MSNFSQFTSSGGVATTQTLTNKTIDIADNTLMGVQASLVSGTNLKTVNGGSILGPGDLEIIGFSNAKAFFFSGS